MNQIRLSATAIGDYLACPQKYRMRHVEQIFPIVDADSLRQGSSFHECFEYFEIGGMDAVVDFLNEKYATIPSYKTAEEFGCEREMILALFLVYQEYWQDQKLEVRFTEKKFELPLMNPATKLPVHPKLALITGRLDAVVQFNGQSCVFEHKTTSSDLSADSDYWAALRKNLQVSMYALAARYLGDNKWHSNCLYDVVRKPRHRLNKNETVEEYGERLRTVLSEKPHEYFARREVSRTTQEVDAFERLVYNVYRAIRTMGDGQYWFENFHSCKNPFPCEFIPICFGPGADSVTTDSEPPARFKRISLHIAKPEV